MEDWVEQLQAVEDSATGYTGYLIERFRNKADQPWVPTTGVPVLLNEAADAIVELKSYLDEEREKNEQLRSTLRGVLACCQEPHGLGDPGRLSAIHSITYKALEDDDE